MDPSLSQSPEAGTATLAHELGHAKTPAINHDPTPYPNRQAYVDDMVNQSLEHEGQATLNNAKVRQEILDNGGPDIGFPGDTSTNGGQLSGNGVEYDSIYKDVQSGAKTQQQGAQEIGEIYRNGETASTDASGQPRGYGPYMAEQYGNYYDAVMGPGTGTP